MTDPTPTRAEVERYALWIGEGGGYHSKEPDGSFVRYDDYAALHERAEASEQRVTELAQALAALMETSKAAVTEASAAEAAACEAAAGVADSVAKELDDAGGYYELQEIAKEIASRIRALRRVPAEGGQSNE